MTERASFYGALVIITLLMVVALVAPYFEMQTFNKFSDKKATYWDAMFSELRIEATDKK